MNFPFELPHNKLYDAVGFGTNAVDYLIRLPEYPAFNSKVELDSYTQAAGGEVASSMVGLQRLGMTTAYIGKFGGDPEGEFGLRSLNIEGVDTSHTELVPDAKTQIAFVLIDSQSGERTVLWQRDHKLAYAESEVPLDVAALGRVLHLTPHDAKACIRLAKAARSSGTLVSIDIDNLFDGVEELLPLVDIFLASADLPEKLFGVTDEYRALSEIRSRFGCPVIGLTRGAAGSMVLAEDSIIETGGFDVPGGCVDTTGAGDAFRAGFLYGVLSGRSVEDTALIANATAALKCRGIGARDKLPTNDELNMLLKNV